MADVVYADVVYDGYYCNNLTNVLLNVYSPEKEAWLITFTYLYINIPRLCFVPCTWNEILYYTIYI